jgi:hypothetical protein
MHSARWFASLQLQISLITQRLNLLNHCTMLTTCGAMTSYAPDELRGYTKRNKTQQRRYKKFSKQNNTLSFLSQLVRMSSCTLKNRGQAGELR